MTEGGSGGHAVTGGCEGQAIIRGQWKAESDRGTVEGRE